MTRLNRAVCFILLATTAAALAHETDQYSVPTGQQFADLGPYFTKLFYGYVAGAVDELNGQIRRLKERGIAGAPLERWQSPRQLARSVFLRIPPVVAQIDGIEIDLNSRPVRTRYPGMIVGHLPPDWIYYHWLLTLDSTKTMRLVRVSTVHANGVYFGTDKIAHFCHMGYLYYDAYWTLRGQGVPLEEATRRAAEMGYGSNPVVSEKTLLGMMMTGVYSNADLASNYAGLKFFQNLTEPVRIRGELRAPMLVLKDDYWTFADYVRPDSDFFVEFITPHWDEALNPGLYVWGMKAPILEAVQNRCRRIRSFYTDMHGVPRPRSYFQELIAELSTYYGEEYGHDGTPAELITLSDTCFQACAPEEQIEPVPAETREAAAESASTALHTAAECGDLPALERALAAGVDVDAPLRKVEAVPALQGATALHVACANGHAAVVQRLLERGASLQARMTGGVTPLHQAIQHPEIVRAVLAAGAEIDAADEAQRTALWWAADAGSDETVELLLARGANANAADADGETPVHAAARRGHYGIMSLLLSAGGDVNARALYGQTPLHLAVRANRATLVTLLIEGGANIKAWDEFGYTALHEAALGGDPALVALLLRHGAVVGARDIHGATPLHLAARRGDAQVVRALLDAGADRSARRQRGRTPQAEAAAAGWTNLARLLDPQG